jgi:acyl-coenzyme A thioesterase PaaI-like protein
MGAAAWTLGHKVLAANLNINYHKPVPLNTSLIVHGWVESHEGRKVFTAGEIILPDGSVSTSGTGLFIEAPDIFGGRDYSIPTNKG